MRTERIWLMVNRRTILAFAAAMFIGVFGARADDKDKKHEHHHGPNDGEIAEVGDDADTHLEIVHDQKAGKLTVYVLGKDMKTAVNLSEAPKLNLKSKKGNKQLEMTGKDSKWEATDDLLKEEADGRIQVKLADGKKYNVKLEHHHH